MKPKEYLKQLRNNLSKPPKELLFTYIPTGIGLAIVLFSTLVVILLLYLLPFAKDTFFGRRYEKPPAKAATDFVTANGRNLVLNGNPYKFVGVNRYSIMTIPSPYRGCGGSWTDSQLDQVFQELNSMKATALRFWAFQLFTASGNDFSRMDKLLSLAQLYNIKLIPVLENQWSSCTEGGYKYNTWYQTGYKAPYGAYTLSLKDYTQRFVSRYKDDPRILMWQIMNEAESKDTSGNADNTSLYNFAQDMANYIKSIDQNHMVSLGTLGSGGQPGTAGQAYYDLHNISSIDIVEAHDYGAPGEALQGSPLKADFGSEIYVQDQNWGWNGMNYQKTILGDWTVFTGTIPAAVVTPLKRIGFHISKNNNWSGSMYIDNVSIGSNNYSFEDGTTQGWSFDNSSTPIVAGISNSSDVAKAGARSLKIQLNSNNGDGYIYLVPTSTIGAGTVITFYVYTPSNAPTCLCDTVASDMRIAQDLNKPFFIGEAGIKSNCTAADCLPVNTRASDIDAKIKANFNNGGVGYLIWSYRDSSGPTQDYQFDYSDPLVSVVSNDATLFAPPPVAPTSTTAPTPTPTGNPTPTPRSSPSPTPIPIPTNTPTPIPPTLAVSPDTTPPTVSITNPLNGAVLSKAVYTSINVNATDNVGVVKVQIWINNVLQRTFTSTPYSYSWSPSKRGTYKIEARAYDAAGNNSSSIITVTAQ